MFWTEASGFFFDKYKHVLVTPYIKQSTLQIKIETWNVWKLLKYDVENVD